MSGGVYSCELCKVFGCSLYSINLQLTVLNYRVFLKFSKRLLAWC